MSKNEQKILVASLREGDVIRARHSAWPEDSFIAGPLYGDSNLRCCGYLVGPDYMVFPAWKVEVIRRAPRKFYTNVERSKPVVGDVAHTVDTAVSGEHGPWFYTANGWISTRGVPIIGDMPREGNVLLVDGTTRRAVL